MKYHKAMTFVAMATIGFGAVAAVNTEAHGATRIGILKATPPVKDTTPRKPVGSRTVKTAPVDPRPHLVASHG